MFSIKMGEHIRNKTYCIDFTYVSTDHWDYQQTMHEYLRAQLNVFTQSATENTVVMVKKDSNSLLPKWVTGN